MASNTIDYLAGAIRSSLYWDGQLIDKNCTVDLPDLAYQTADIPAMGTMAVPLPGLYEDAEMVYHPTNSTKASARMYTPGTHTIDYRWNQIEYGENTAEQKLVTHRVIATGTPKKKQHARTIAPGQKPEGEIPIALFSYRYYVDGETMVEWDRFTWTDNLMGEDYGYDYSKNL